jgi:CheY-like chemotaxis protein
MSTKAILLVEDGQYDELLTLRALRKVNLANQVEVVRDGQQALDYLFGQGEFAHRAGAELPAVILLDINLPRVGGLDVLARVRSDARTCLVPIVLLISSDEQRDRLRSYESDRNSFVHKPLQFREFAETVAQFGIRWVATNQPPLDRAHA